LTTDESYLIPVGFYTGRRELSWPTRVNGIPVVTSVVAGIRPTAIPTTPLAGEIAGARDASPRSFFLDVLFIQGIVEDTPSSDDGPTILGKKPS
jgi:hypothetical protein